MLRGHSLNGLCSMERESESHRAICARWAGSESRQARFNMPEKQRGMQPNQTESCSQCKIKHFYRNSEKLSQINYLVITIAGINNLAQKPNWKTEQNQLPAKRPQKNADRFGLRIGTGGQQVGQASTKLIAGAEGEELDDLNIAKAPMINFNQINYKPITAE